MKVRIHASLLVLAFAVSLTGCATVPPPPPAARYATAAPLTPIKRTDHPVVVVALSGGAVRGFAHAGVLRVLDENGIKPDAIVGTSAGSVVGALYAGGIRNDALVEAALELQRAQVIEFTYPNRGFVNGQRLQDYIDKRLGDRPIERLNPPFVAVATDLRSGKLVAFNRGDTGMAVRASSSVPAVFQPMTMGGRDYVDGGLVSPVPVRVARALGADIVIAVDVTHQPTAEKQFDSTGALVAQSLIIMEHALAENELKEADIVIRPDLRQAPTASFDLRAETIAAGERAARAALPRIRELLESKRRQLFKFTGHRPDASASRGEGS
jgi:NTE family protein